MFSIVADNVGHSLRSGIGVVVRRCSFIHKVECEKLEEEGESFFLTIIYHYYS